MSSFEHNGSKIYYEEEGSGESGAATDEHLPPRKGRQNGGREAQKSYLERETRLELATLLGR
jgi:hypothetical protein